jgi:hypothetical protein
MARNTKPDYKSVTCEFDVQKDFERTKPNLGLTPQQVAEMAKRGIPVSPMNVNFIDVNGDASWNIEPYVKFNATARLPISRVAIPRLD